MVARRDREEALAGLDDVPGRRSDVTGQRAICPRTCDAVGNETASTLEAAQCETRTSREPPVDASEAEPVTTKAELEHRDVPAHGADSEFALSEKRPSACAERTPRRSADAPRRTHASCPLEPDQSVGCELATDAVDRTRIEPVGTEPDLESGDASTGREPAGSEREDTNGHRDANDGEATHATEFGGRISDPPRRTSLGARLQSGRCLPR